MIRPTLCIPRQVPVKPSGALSSLPYCHLIQLLAGLSSGRGAFTLSRDFEANVSARMAGQRYPESLEA